MNSRLRRYGPFLAAILLTALLSSPATLFAASSITGPNLIHLNGTTVTPNNSAWSFGGGAPTPIASGGTGNTTGIAFGALYSNGSIATTTTLATIGSGYAKGDTITLTGGTCTVSPILSVQSTTSPNGTGVSLFQVTNPGICTAIPSNPISQGSTSGAGSGATFNLSWGLIAANTSLPTLGSANGNAFYGAEQPDSSLIGAENAFFGDRAGGGFATTSSFDVAVGHNACGFGGTVRVNGGSIVCIGTDAGRNIAPGIGGATLIGANAGRNENGIGDTFVGLNAGRSILSGNGSTFIGNAVANLATTSVFRDTLIGGGAGAAIATNGNDDVFIGDSAGATSTYNTTAASVIIGSGAGQNTASNSGLVAIGYQALQLSYGTGQRDITAIGRQSLQNLKTNNAAQIVAVGNNSLLNLDTGNSGANDTAIGYNSCPGASATVNFLQFTCLGANTGGALTGGNHDLIVGQGVANTTYTGGTNDIFIGSGQATVDATSSNPSISNFLNLNNAIYATNMTSSGSAPGGNVLIGTSTAPSSLARLVVAKEPAGDGTVATTTIDFGDYATSTSRTCFNANNAVGSAVSFYVGASNTIVVEANRCK